MRQTALQRLGTKFEAQLLHSDYVAYYAKQSPTLKERFGDFLRPQTSHPTHDQTNEKKTP